MDAQYWLHRWRDGRTGWHHDKPMPLLVEHWQALAVPPATRVLVPLCGKSLDMLWLSRQGYDVLGVELAPAAIDAFLVENDLEAQSVDTAGAPTRQVANPPGGAIGIVNGDIFALDASVFAGCGAFYDRAAMIALPNTMRERLVREVYTQLPAGATGLLITLDYPSGQIEAPPFPVGDNEVHHLFDAGWEVRQLEDRDILDSQPSFAEQGVTSLHTAVYALRRRG